MTTHAYEVRCAGGLAAISLIWSWNRMPYGCAMLRAIPKDERAYATVVFAVAQTDNAILEYRYFEDGATTPYRIITTPRSAMRERGGHLLPTRFEVRNLERGTSTDLAILELAVDRPIEDRLFSLRALEQNLELPPAD